MNLVDRVIAIRDAGKVERVHTLPHHGSYSIAAHSWQAAMLLYLLWPDRFKQLVIHALAHDIPEHITGDVPAPMKKVLNERTTLFRDFEDNILRRYGLPINALPKEDQDRLRACDYLEFYMWCRDQLHLGNKFVENALGEISWYLDQAYLPPPADELWYDLRMADLMPESTGRLVRTINEEV